MTLIRRTPLKAQPRAKGNRGELQVIELLRSWGWPGARRNWQSGGQGGGDIVNGPQGTTIEVKYCERATIWSWWEQTKTAAKATDMPILAFRRNRSEWLVCIPLEDLLDLLKFREEE